MGDKFINSRPINFFFSPLFNSSLNIFFASKQEDVIMAKLEIVWLNMRIESQIMLYVSDAFIRKNRIEMDSYIYIGLLVMALAMCWHVMHLQYANDSSTRLKRREWVNKSIQNSNRIQHHIFIIQAVKS